jgi:hypothetical protein
VRYDRNKKNIIAAHNGISIVFTLNLSAHKLKKWHQRKHRQPEDALIVIEIIRREVPYDPQRRHWYQHGQRVK